MSELNWIKPVILKQWPSIIEKGGVDFDNDGKVSLSEKLNDYEQDGNPLGDKQDFWIFMSAHQHQIAQHIEFVDSSQDTTLDNPLNNYLYENKETVDYKQVYDLLETILLPLTTQQDKLTIFNTLTDSETFQVFNNILDSDAQEIMQESLAHELNINLVSYGYNLGTEQYNDTNYAQSITILEKTLALTMPTEKHNLIVKILFSAHYNNAISAINNSDYQLARELLTAAPKYALTVEEKDKLQNMVGKTYRYEGVQQFNKGEFELAITNYQKALEYLNLAKDIDNCTNGIAACHYNLANKLFAQQDYEKAIELYIQTKETTADPAIATKANQQIGRSYYNMAIKINTSMTNHDLSKYMLMKNILESALKYVPEQALKERIVTFLEQIAEVLK